MRDQDDNLTQSDMLELFEQTLEKLGTRNPSMQEYWQAVKER